MALSHVGLLPVPGHGSCLGLRLGIGLGLVLGLGKAVGLGLGSGCVRVVGFGPHVFWIVSDYVSVSASHPQRLGSLFHGSACQISFLSASVPPTDTLDSYPGESYVSTGLYTD